MFARIEAWIVLTFLAIAVPSVVVFGWIVQDRATGGERTGPVGDAFLAIARAPSPLFHLLGRLSDGEDVLQPQLIRFDDFAGMKVYDQTFHDDGTLLVSAFSKERGVSTAYLYDIATGRKLHEWDPPVDEINAQTSFVGPENIRQNYHTQHPLLLNDGDIVITSGEGPLARVTACGDLVWAVDRRFHHSIELTAEGTLLVPEVIEDAEPPEGVATPLRDDGWAEVGLDGEVLGEWSVAGILARHGYSGLLDGVGPFEEDRIHLNDAQPILQSDGFVEAGDVALSARHLSTVFLYRPRTDEVIWLSVGPWLNQHDVDYLGDGVFSIFGNGNVRGPVDEEAIRGGSTVWLYDMKTGRATPLREMADLGIFTNEEGRQRVLGNGDVFIEETNKNTLHRVSPQGLRWSYVSSAGEGRIGALHWSRYLTKAESDFPWLRGLACGG